MISSNEAARLTWNAKAVGAQRARAPRGSKEYFQQIRAYRYGYETPWIPRIFRFAEMGGKRVLEIGIGNGIDGVEMAKSGATYHGLDITRNHIELTRENFAQHGLTATLHEGDLTELAIAEKFDVVYSFGVLHHIDHEAAYLSRIRDLLAPDGRLMIAVYSKYSFLNAYLCATWLIRGRGRSLDDWRSHWAEGSAFGCPVTIKIRSRSAVEAMLRRCGFAVERYCKRGFVQNYLPVVGRRLSPDGFALNLLGGLLGWYHIFICRAATATE
jgi:SAM-dependent methyltransferase